MKLTFERLQMYAEQRGLEARMMVSETSGRTLYGVYKGVNRLVLTDDLRQASRWVRTNYNTDGSEIITPEKRAREKLRSLGYGLRFDVDEYGDKVFIATSKGEDRYIFNDLDYMAEHIEEIANDCKSGDA